MRFGMEGNIERLSLARFEKVADLKIMVFHFRRQLKIVAELDEMSHKGTQQSMGKDSSTSSASSTSTTVARTFQTPGRQQQ